MRNLTAVLIMILFAGLQVSGQDTIMDFGIILIEDSANIDGHLNLHLKKGAGTELFGGIIEGLSGCLCAQNGNGGGNTNGNNNNGTGAINCHFYDDFEYEINLGYSGTDYYKPIFVVPDYTPLNEIDSIAINYYYFNSSVEHRELITGVVDALGNVWYFGTPISGSFTGFNIHEQIGNGNPITWPGTGNGYQEIIKITVSIYTHCGVYGVEMWLDQFNQYQLGWDTFKF